MQRVRGCSAPLSVQAGRATCPCTASCCSCPWSRPAVASTVDRRALWEPPARNDSAASIFDISDIRNPKQLAAVQTCRGSHTHTLVTDPKDKANIYIYG